MANTAESLPVSPDVLAAGDYSLAKLIVSAPKVDIDFDGVRDRSDTGRDVEL